MAELSFRALADAGVLVTCPLANCGDQLHPRALRRHLEGQKHRLAGEELLDSCKRARCLPCAFTLSGGATNAELEAVTPIADAGMLSLALPTVPVSPEQLRLYFSSFYDADGGCPVAVATLALRVHLDEPNVSIEHAAEAVRSAALLCDDLVLSACGAFVSRADTLPTGGEQPTVSGGPCCADGASWLPWANATECVLWLLFHKLALSEEQQAVVLQTLRLPCFRLAHVPLSPAFYQRVAKDIRPCVGRVVVETPTEAGMTVDVLLPSELIRVAVNAPRMFSTLRFKPFAYDVHDPCADHFNSSRLARRHPLSRIESADTPAGRIQLGDVVRVKGRVVRIIELYLVHPPTWTATATERVCPESAMVHALGGEALLTRADAGASCGLAPAGPQWEATYGIRKAERVDERHRVSDVTHVYRRVPSFTLAEDWRGGDASAVRVLFELTDERPRAVRFLDATHRAYAPLRTMDGVRIFDGDASPVLWAGTQQPKALPWDFTSHAAVDGNHRWIGDASALPRLVLNVAGDSDAADVSHNKTGRAASLLRASTTLLSGPRSARHRPPGFAPLAIMPKEIGFDALESVKQDFERLEEGAVFFSSVLGGHVHVVAVLSLYQVDSADRFGHQGLPSFHALHGCCGGCDMSHVSGDDRSSFLQPVSLASLRTDAKALANAGTLGWPATPAPYTARLRSFDNFQQTVVGPLHFAILGVVRKALVLLAKRTVGQNGTPLSDYLQTPLAALEAALADDDKHCAWTARVLSFRAVVKALNGVLTSRLLEVFLFAVNEVVALGKQESRALRVDAMTGLVDFVLGLRYLMQAPSTARARAEASRLMVAGVSALAKAFPPGTHKGTGANGLHSVLAHLTLHIDYLLQLYATACNVDDAVVEERHQPMKARANNVNRGRRDTWSRTIHANLRLQHSVRLMFQEQRYGDGLRSRLGAAAAAFSTQQHAAVGKLVWGSASYSDAVEVVDRSADDLTPRPSFVAPGVAACAPLPCWCCPGYTAQPSLVMWRRSTVAGDISLTFGVGGVPSEPRKVKAMLMLPPDRWRLTRQSFIAAFPGVASAVDTMGAFGGLKLPGIASPMRVSDWVLLDRAKVLSAWKLQRPESHDHVVHHASATFDRLIVVEDDYQFWPERYVAARVRDIFAVEVGGVYYSMFTPVYYEFFDAPSGTPAGENLMAYARDTARGAARPVGTQSWIVERWMGGAGALLDEMPLPTGVIRRVPNIVHACTVGGCTSRDACVHGMYTGLPEPVRTMLASGCSCSAKAKCTRRIVHSCGSNDRWLVSPFDLGNKSRVQW